MADPNPRLSALERQVRALERELAGLHARHEPSALVPGVRVAVTSRDPNTNSYPTSISSPRRYWVRFVDLAPFTLDDGPGGITWTGRSTNARTVVGALTANYIAENTLIAIFRANGRWWTQGPLIQAGFARWVIVRATATFSNSTNEIPCSVMAYWEGDNPGASVMVRNTPTIDAGTGIFTSNGSHPYNTALRGIAVYRDSIQSSTPGALKRYQAVWFECPVTTAPVGNNDTPTTILEESGLQLPPLAFDRLGSPPELQEYLARLE